MSLKFTRVIEDFVCEHCGTSVKGNGFTNHCPTCLWSKHVDNYPGDRAADCGGLMEPIGVEIVGGEYILLHKCIECGHVKKNKTSPEDDFDAILELSRNVANDFYKNSK